MRVIFLYYQDTWQEIALQLVAAKLKAAHMVEGNLAQSLAAMEVDDGNLMDALMKAVAQGRPRVAEWSGMQIAQVSRAMPSSEPRQKSLLLPLTEPKSDLEITEVAVEGGAVQYAFF